MLRVEAALFSNVVTTVMRTGSLPGGSVTGLPGGLIIEGLRGVQSVGSDMGEAQKEFELGRRMSSLQRVRQIETQFESTAGRWNATITGLVSSARQGNQRLSLQKLNEVKAAQVKMQQLIGPASKSIRDLVLALEQSISDEGRDERIPSGATFRSDAPPSTPPQNRPDDQLLGSFAVKYQVGSPFRLRKHSNGRTSLHPRPEVNQFVLMEGLETPRVVRIREVQAKGIRVFDPQQAAEREITGSELIRLVKHGMWTLQLRTS